MSAQPSPSVHWWVFLGDCSTLFWYAWLLSLHHEAGAEAMAMHSRQDDIIKDTQKADQERLIHTVCRWQAATPLKNNPRNTCALSRRWSVPGASAVHVAPPEAAGFHHVQAGASSPALRQPVAAGPRTTAQAGQSASQVGTLLPFMLHACMHALVLVHVT